MSSMTTVKQLIEKLQKLPADALVVTRDGHIDDITLQRSEGDLFVPADNDSEGDLFVKIGRRDEPALAKVTFS